MMEKRLCSGKKMCKWSESGLCPGGAWASDLADSGVVHSLGKVNFHLGQIYYTTPNTYLYLPSQNHIEVSIDHRPDKGTVVLN